LRARGRGIGSLFQRGGRGAEWAKNLFLEGDMGQVDRSLWGGRRQKPETNLFRGNKSIISPEYI